MAPILHGIPAASPESGHISSGQHERQSLRSFSFTSPECAVLPSIIGTGPQSLQSGFTRVATGKSTLSPPSSLPTMPRVALSSLSPNPKGAAPFDGEVPHKHPRVKPPSHTLDMLGPFIALRACTTNHYPPPSRSSSPERGAFPCLTHALPIPRTM